MILVISYTVSRELKFSPNYIISHTFKKTFSNIKIFYWNVLSCINILPNLSLVCEKPQTNRNQRNVATRQERRITTHWWRAWGSALSAFEWCRLKSDMVERVLTNNYTHYILDDIISRSTDILAKADIDWEINVVRVNL